MMLQQEIGIEWFVLYSLCLEVNLIYSLNKALNQSKQTFVK